MASLFGFPEQTDPPSQDESERVTTTEGQEYSPRERALRDLFVAEYIIDYDHIKAAQRCGFNLQLAVEWGSRFLSEPYVQLRINRLGVGKNDATNPDVIEYNRKRIQEALMREAHNHGPGSSHAARVSALKALAEMHGMIKKEIGKPGEKGSKGGVMQVPGIANLDDWEQTAAASQDALTAHAADE